MLFVELKHIIMMNLFINFSKQLLVDQELNKTKGLGIPVLRYAQIEQNEYLIILNSDGI